MKQQRKTGEKNPTGGRDLPNMSTAACFQLLITDLQPWGRKVWPLVTLVPHLLLLTQDKFAHG